MPKNFSSIARFLGEASLGDVGLPKGPDMVEEPPGWITVLSKAAPFLVATAVVLLLVVTYFIATWGVTAGASGGAALLVWVLGLVFMLWRF